MPEIERERDGCESRNGKSRIDKWGEGGEGREMRKNQVLSLSLDYFPRFPSYQSYQVLTDFTRVVRVLIAAVISGWSHGVTLMKQGKVQSALVFYSYSDNISHLSIAI